MNSFCLQQLGIAWPELTSLHFEVRRGAEAEDETLEGLHHFPQLASLSVVNRGYASEDVLLIDVPMVDLREVPESLTVLSLYGINITTSDMTAIAARCQRLAHVRLMHCCVHEQLLHVMGPALGPQLRTLVIKETGSMAFCNLAPIAAFSCLASLAISIDPDVDLRPLANLSYLKHLMLDTKYSSRLAQGLRHLTNAPGLRHLLLPLLQLHQCSSAMYAVLRDQLAGCTLNDLNKLFGVENGSKWCAEVPTHETDWFVPATPWQWQPVMIVFP